MTQFELLATTCSSDLLKIIASMQLLPCNHGKYIRLEALARISVSNINTNSDPVSLKSLRDVIQQEYGNSEHECRPVNLFTENIMFYGGNYIVFPGTIESGTNILNTLIQTIFFTVKDDALPKVFKENVYSGVFLVLNLCNHLAQQCELVRNHSEKISNDQLELPTAEKIEQYKDAVVFTENWLKEKGRAWKINGDIIQRFLVDVKDLRLREEHPLESPLKARPFVKRGSEYIFVQPSSSVGCLIKFIWDEARATNCYEELLEQYHEYTWIETQRLLAHMQWLPMGVKLPPLPESLFCVEEVFTFDLNKIGYLIFLKTGYSHSFAGKGVRNIEKPSVEALHYRDLLEKRRYEVLDHIRKSVQVDEIQFLTLYVVSEVGFPQQLMVQNSSHEQLSLGFRYTELKHLVQFEESDPLLLWKFSKAYTEVIEKCELRYLGGMLDVFACYKDYDYTLWPLDKELPELIVIMQSASDTYVRQSILKRDEHLAPFMHGGNIVYKPVFCDYSYAPLYQEVGETIPCPILLEDFIVPIWFINHQKETQHEILISSQLGMIAFWLHKLGPYEDSGQADPPCRGMLTHPLPVSDLMLQRY